MSDSNFTGITSYGVPIFGSDRFTNPWNTHYFVDGVNGSDGNTGKETNAAFATIQRADDVSIGGDVIYIRPKGYKNGTGFARYTEDVVIAQGSQVAAATDTQANKSIIGVTQRPCPTDFLGVRWTKATATPLTNYTPGLHIESIGFFVEGATYALNLYNDAPTYYGATGVSIYNCAIKGDGKIICLYGCDELQIVHCRFQAKYDGPTGGISLVGSSGQVKRPLIRDCEFIGGNAYNMDTCPITTAAPVWDAIIRDCYFSAAPDDGYYINIGGTSNDGLVANCYFASGNCNAQFNGIIGGSSGIYAAGIYDDDGIEDMSE